MIDIWVKLVSNQFELALQLTRAVFGLGASEAPAPVHGEDPETAASDAGKSQERRIDSQASSVQAGGAEIQNIISFLESADRGATVREIAEHLKTDRAAVLPLLKTLVKERRIDELLGRYCLIRSN